jgi:hypothetical protein
MRKILLTLGLLPLTAWANLHLAPPDFDGVHGRSIFVDFKHAEYDITYNPRALTTTVHSRIKFSATRRGKPLFDLKPLPRNLRLNGVPVTQQLTSFPGGVSALRIVDHEIQPGEHVLEMVNEFKTNVSYNRNSVLSAFWIRDLKDRMFLEQYIPSNFEFDQYKMVLNIKVEGVANPPQDIYTNGTLTQTAGNSWRIEFPEWYTVSCPYFHITSRGAMKKRKFTYRSIDGRDIPITIYSPFRFRTNTFATHTIKYMKELEDDYGPWPHPSFVAYGTMPGTGGMEHAGATATSLGALDHEMIHSYFAKGLVPANGNSGWLDEAIASWRDRGYPRNPDPGFGGSNIGARSVYARNTDSRSYGLGSAFLSYLDYRLQDVGGLKTFLKAYAQAYMHTVITTEHFKNNLEFFTGINFEHEFATYIWGENTQDAERFHGENPHHRELSAKQLKSLL